MTVDDMRETFAFRNLYPAMFGLWDCTKVQYIKAFS